MKRIRIISGLAVLLLATVFLQSCITGVELRTRPVDRARISGTYTLFLYGCHYPDQVENAAILVDENSKYPLEIYDLDTSYKVKKGLSAQQALAEADTFVRCSTHSIWLTQVVRIPDDVNGTIGYEMRPLYHPLEFGFSDVMTIGYRLQDGKVRTYIRKVPELERMPGAGDERGLPTGIIRH